MEATPKFISFFYIIYFSTGKFYCGGLIRSDAVKVSWIVLNTPILLTKTFLLSFQLHVMHFFQFSFDQEYKYNTHPVLDSNVIFCRP